MTKKIGNKREAHQRGKKERIAIRKANIAREAVRRAAARARYRHQQKGKPMPVVAIPA